MAETLLNAGTQLDLDNPTGAYVELTKSVSEGKAEIAEALTLKGADSTVSDTLSQMATKLNNLAVEGEKEYLIGYDVDVTNTSSSFGYNIMTRIPGTNRMIASTMTPSTVYILDVSNGCSVLGSVATGITAAVSSGSESPVFIFSRNGDYAVIKTTTQMVGISIASDGTPSVNGVLTTLTSQYNVPLVVSNDGSKVLVIGFSSTSSSTSILKIYNLSDGTSIDCTNSASYSFASIMYGGGETFAFNCLASDNTTVYSVGFPRTKNTAANTSTFRVMTSTIDWANATFAAGTSSEDITVPCAYYSLSTYNGYLDPKNLVFYCTFMEDLGDNCPSMTYSKGRQLCSLNVVDLPTKTVFTKNIVNIRYLISGYNFSQESPTLYIEHQDNYAEIYTFWGILKYTELTKTLEFVTTAVELEPNKYMAAFQRVQAPGSANTNYMSGSFYRSGDIVYGLGGANNMRYNAPAVYINCLYNSTRNKATDFSKSKSASKRYVIGYVYHRNGKYTYFTKPKDVLSQTELDSGALNVEEGN